MTDEDKTKEQLIKELNELHNRLTELEVADEEPRLDDPHAESREIDLEKLTRQKQSALEERYRALFENNIIETIIVDHETKVTGSNLAKGRLGGRVPAIGEVMYKDYAGKHEIDMHRELVKCINSGVSKEFPKQKYGSKFLQIRISPFSEGAIITSIDITERVLAETSMRKSQRQTRVLAHALENCSQPFAVGYPDGRIMTYNTAFCKLTGYSKEELRELKRFQDITTKAGHDVMIKAEEKIRQTKQPQRFEMEYMCKDHSRVPVEVWEHPIFDSKGNLLHLYAFIRDIKDHKLAEEALKKSEARYHALLGENPIETILVDPEARVIDSNLSKINSDGTAPRFGDVMFKDYARELGVGMHTELIECMKSGISKEFPGQKCGNRYLSLKISPFSGGAFITSMDLTELKLLNETLRESREEYRKIFENAMTPIVIVEEDLTLSRVNGEFEKFSGYARQDLEGKMKWSEFVAGKDVERVKRYHARLRQGKEGMPDEYEFFFTDKTGNEKEVVINVGMISGTRRCIGSMLDISPYKHELESRVTELKQAQEELSQYSHILSDDLRAPLRAIRNYAEFFREDMEETLNGDQKLYMDGIGRAAGEAEHMVQDLLEFSRIEREGIAIKKVRMDVFLRELIDSLPVLSGVNVVIANDWPTIEVQASLLYNIFYRLIDNAIKFNKSPQKLIEIGWKPADGEHYEFYVRDNGIGINLRYREKIFGLFERLYTSEEYQGTGIGLAVVKKCADKLGGSIRLESEPGEGSTFFVTLPRAPEKRE
jgi:PAS domain S-box-containing protein